MTEQPTKAMTCNCGCQLIPKDDGGWTINPCFLHDPLQQTAPERPRRSMMAEQPKVNPNHQWTEQDKATPGPWIMRREDVRYSIGPSESSTSPSIVAVTCGGNDEANARLIAAAPVLLKMLVVAQDWLADKGVPFDHIEMVRIRAAVAKAREVDDG